MICTLLATIYGLLIILIGLIFSITEAVQSAWLNTYYNGVFLVYIYTVATGFILIMEFYVLPSTSGEAENSHHANLNQTQQKFEVDVFSSSTDSPAQSPTEEHRHRSTSLDSGMPSLPFRENQSHNDFTTRPRSVSEINIPTTTLGNNSSFVKIEMSDVETDSNDQHHGGSSFYLRFGFLVFGMGNMIYVILEIVNLIHTCDAPKFSWTFVLRFLFLVCQTFYLFKNSSVHIYKHHSLAQVASIHLIATNICVWTKTLIHEISHAYHLTDEIDGHIVEEFDNITGNETCAVDQGIVDKARPYLFPFVLEYSLIAVGIFAIMANKISNNKKTILRMTHSTKKTYPNNNKNSVDIADSLSDFSSHFGPMHCKQGPTVLHFRNANKGLFAGTLVLCLTIVCIIMFFVEIDNENEDTGPLIYLICDIVLHGLMMLACISSLWSLRNLPLKSIPFSQIDDILLVIGMSGSVLLELSIVVSCSVYIQGDMEGSIVNALSLTSAIVSVTQTFLQTILIESGLRKYCDSYEQHSRLPGRQSITFLIVCNVTMWIFRTTQVKELNMGIQEDFYGSLAWLFIMNLNLPLLLFFYFHSSICLAEVWIKTYELKQSENTNQPYEILRQTSGFVNSVSIDVESNIIRNEQADRTSHSTHM